VYLCCFVILAARNFAPISGQTHRAATCDAGCVGRVVIGGSYLCLLPTIPNPHSQSTDINKKTGPCRSTVSEDFVPSLEPLAHTHPRKVAEVRRMPFKSSSCKRIFSLLFLFSKRCVDVITYPSCLVRVSAYLDRGYRFFPLFLEVKNSWLRSM
jgi:hypothetical protein